MSATQFGGDVGRTSQTVNKHARHIACLDVNPVDRTGENVQSLLSSDSLDRLAGRLTVTNSR